MTDQNESDLWLGRCIREGVERELASGEPYSCEVVFRMPDGRRIEMLIQLKRKDKA